MAGINEFFEQFNANAVAIFTTFASIFVTFVATYLTMAKSKSMILFRGQLIDINKDIVSRVHALKVTFDDSPVELNTFLLHCVLFNSGDIDIHKPDVIKPISVTV